MCSRYYIDKKTREHLQELFDDCEEREEMFPGDYIPVIINEKGLKGTKLKWGYSMSMTSSLIINARCESVHEKKMFRQDLQERRCLIPASRFYEWDALKHRIAFENGEDILWLAGIYNRFKEIVIITTKANQVMKDIHSRMPLMIYQRDIKKWFDDELYKDILIRSNDDLKIVSGNIQQSLFE